MNKEMIKSKRTAPSRIISLGFAIVIFVGALLLYLPFTHNPGIDVSITDAFFTSTSAVCVTGLIAIDTADTFNVIGQVVVALLIQIGGLGITSIGVGFIILSGRKIGFRERILVKEALNYNSFKGVIMLVKNVLQTTLFIELIGAILSFIVFSNDYPLGNAVWISIFHSVASFNNSGFDILGGGQNLIPYSDNVLLNLTTCFLIICGGLGFFVIREFYRKRSFKRCTLHTKIAFSVTIVLLICGTLILKLTDNISWLEAFFASTTARTAGFSTFPMNNLSNAGLFILIILMFIGASPGSTGGGIKTTTFFVLIRTALALSSNKTCEAFKRKIPDNIIRKAFVVTVLALSIVIVSTLLLSILEPQINFIHLLFEAVSAFGTVGLSAGVTTTLSTASKWVLIFTMYIGRLGPLTIASLWFYNNKSIVTRAEGNLTVG